MSGLPEGWESDYDGQRWFYRYKSSGITQYRFPKPGDEFPDFIDPHASRVDLAPEERLESDRQIKRKSLPASALSRIASTKAAPRVGVSAIHEAEDEAAGEWDWRRDNFMYFGPGSPGVPSPKSENKSRKSDLLSPNPNPEAAYQVSPIASGNATPQVASGEVVPVSAPDLPAKLPLQGNCNNCGPSPGNAVAATHGLAIRHTALFAQQPVYPHSIPAVDMTRQEADIPRLHTALHHELGLSSPNGPSTYSSHPSSQRRLTASSWTPVNFIAEMPTESTAKCYEELYPTPIELPGSEIVSSDVRTMLSTQTEPVELPSNMVSPETTPLEPMSSTTDKLVSPELPCPDLPTPICGPSFGSLDGQERSISWQSPHSTGAAANPVHRPPPIPRKIPLHMAHEPVQPAMSASVPPHSTVAPGDRPSTGHDFEYMQTAASMAQGHMPEARPPARSSVSDPGTPSSTVGVQSMPSVLRPARGRHSLSATNSSPVGNGPGPNFHAQPKPYMTGQAPTGHTTPQGATPSTSRTGTPTPGGDEGVAASDASIPQVESFPPGPVTATTSITPTSPEYTIDDDQVVDTVNDDSIVETPSGGNSSWSLNTPAESVSNFEESVDDTVMSLKQPGEEETRPVQSYNIDNGIDETGSQHTLEPAQDASNARLSPEATSNLASGDDKVSEQAQSIEPHEQEEDTTDAQATLPDPGAHSASLAPGLLGSEDVQQQHLEESPIPHPSDPVSQEISKPGTPALDYETPFLQEPSEIGETSAMQQSYTAEDAQQSVASSSVLFQSTKLSQHPNGSEGQSSPIPAPSALSQVVEQPTALLVVDRRFSGSIIPHQQSGSEIGSTHDLGLLQTQEIRTEQFSAPPQMQTVFRRPSEASSIHVPRESPQPQHTMSQVPPGWTATPGDHGYGQTLGTSQSHAKPNPHEPTMPWAPSHQPQMSSGGNAPSFWQVAMNTSAAQSELRTVTGVHSQAAYTLEQTGQQLTTPSPATSAPMPTPVPAAYYTPVVQSPSPQTNWSPVVQATQFTQQPAANNHDGFLDPHRRAVSLSGPAVPQHSQHSYYQGPPTSVHQPQTGQAQQPLQVGSQFTGASASPPVQSHPFSSPSPQGDRQQMQQQTPVPQPTMQQAGAGNGQLSSALQQGHLLLQQRASQASQLQPVQGMQTQQVDLRRAMTVQYSAAPGVPSQLGQPATIQVSAGSQQMSLNPSRPVMVQQPGPLNQNPPVGSQRLPSPAPSPLNGNSLHQQAAQIGGPLNGSSVRHQANQAPVSGHLPPQAPIGMQPAVTYMTPTGTASTGSNQIGSGGQNGPLQFRPAQIPIQQTAPGIQNPAMAPGPTAIPVQGQVLPPGNPVKKKDWFSKLFEKPSQSNKPNKLHKQHQSRSLPQQQQQQQYYQVQPQQLQIQGQQTQVYAQQQIPPQQFIQNQQQTSFYQPVQPVMNSTMQSHAQQPHRGPSGMQPQPGNFQNQPQPPMHHVQNPMQFGHGPQRQQQQQQQQWQIGATMNGSGGPHPSNINGGQQQYYQHPQQQQPQLGNVAPLPTMMLPQGHNGQIIPELNNPNQEWQPQAGISGIRMIDVSSMAKATASELPTADGGNKSTIPPRLEIKGTAVDEKGLISPLFLSGNPKEKVDGDGVSVLEKEG